jgi:hypothetical protein
MRRRLPGVIAGFGTFFPILASGGPTNSPWNNAGLVVPDIASNIRVDQPWGAAQVMGALHDDRARYYNTTANGVICQAAQSAQPAPNPFGLQTSANSAATGATQLQLPAASNIYAGIQHYWVPNLRTSLYGGYVNYRADRNERNERKKEKYRKRNADRRNGSLPRHWARFKTICNLKRDNGQ